MQYKMSYTREPAGAAPRPTGRPPKAATRAAEGHFDPDELTRRLYIVLAEQQQYAERKLRIRGEPPKPRDGAGPSPSTRHKDHTGHGRKERRESVEAPADLITELRRSKSAKRKPSHTAIATVAAPEAGIAAQAGEYRHVPKEAAKQFTRTTTQENMRSNTDLVHKLSKRALKFHMEGGRATRPGGGSAEAPIAPAELSRVLRRSQSQRDKILERNQFQRTRILDEAAQVDHDAQQHLHSPSKHTFGSELTRMMSAEGHHHAKYNNMHAGRRGSTGSTGMNDGLDQRADDSNHNRRSFMMLEPLVDIIEDVAPPVPVAEEEGEQLACPPHERRVDWTQSDEPSRARPKQLLTPLLRRADSLWTLRGRKGSKGSSSSSGASGYEKGEDKENGSPKSPKVGGFFAKFKR
ncbi:hypothetical protein MFIFM68171_03440 [Madurella fahalii]|uniref:Uncharacterized protein n=1 Tax=Madurella fahalii TaxID=1157608 RepID=A0ABQ0G6M9_9PEZI